MICVLGNEQPYGVNADQRSHSCSQAAQAAPPCSGHFTTMAVLARCGKQFPKWHDSHADRMLTQFERDLFPWIGERTIAEIRAMELLDAIKKT